jgi:heptosyltransferase-2
MDENGRQHRSERTAERDWVVVVRLRQLGDVLAGLETLRALKAHRPDRGVAYVVDAPYHELLGDFPFIDRVLVAPRGRGARAWFAFLRDVRALGAGEAIDLHGSARSAMIARATGARVRVGFDVRGRRLAYTIREPRGEFSHGRRVPRTPLVWGTRLARHVGAAPAGVEPPRLSVTDAVRERGRAQLVASGVGEDALGNRRIIGLNPGRPVPTKSWAAERFAALARRLDAAGFVAVVFWGPGEERGARALVGENGVVMAPSLSLAEVPGALVWMTALVTIDSGLKHLAACLRVPTVTLFGATDPREWHMGGARDVVLWRGLSCSPCRRVRCPFAVPCMDFAEDRVAAAVIAMVEGNA